MSNPISAYTFDEYNMTWITCDMCSGSFQRGSQLCTLCGGSKLRRVSYEYIVQAIGPPSTSDQQSMPPKDGDSKRARRHGHGRGNKV
ncbi:hypothetical protein EDB81DRAFT_883263 [Dactylonectria macrodidyma]|uniref:Uncharacterized protein n=1 Tax=Dactylonectria macrodidyma TaxID=307937 RepID=A0A9P9JA81_9HYPO|nr:hypothetical protein EDB81DRAFT_883263 [Dactylonectria macrodidyma]